MSNVEGALRDFIICHLRRGNDYASTFGEACGPYGAMRDFEKSFDKYWDHYDALQKLQN